MASDSSAWGGPASQPAKRARAEEAAPAADKGDKGGKGMGPDQTALLNSAAKGVMQLMTEVKSLKATVFRNFMFDADSLLAKGIKSQLKEYRDKVHGNPGHSLGPPDVWIWRGIVLCCCDQLGKLGESALAAHQAFQTHASSCLPGELSRLVHHCKLSDCYKKPDKPAKVRLEIGNHPNMEGLVNHLRAYVIMTGGEEVLGKQPRGVIERDIQKLLVKTKVWKDRPPGQPGQAAIGDGMDT